MLLKQKRLTYSLILMLALALTVFLSGHTAYLVENAAFSYLHLYLDKIYVFIMPMLAGWLTLFFAREKRIFSLFCLSFFYTITALLYILPYRYEYLILFEGYMTGEAILISFLYALLMLLENYVTVLAHIFFTLLISRMLYKKPRAEIFRAEQTASPFMLDTPYVGAALITSVLAFFISLAGEIYDTVVFLSEAIDTINTIELITILANYLLIIALFVLSYLLLVRFSGKLEEEVSQI